MSYFNRESDYYMWLLDRIGVLYGKYENYLLLTQHLFRKNFKYVLAMDKNREKAGLSLRTLYSQTYGIYEDDVWHGPCTVLEMLEALAERISFDTGDTIQKWFWEMLDNIDLSQYTDDVYEEAAVEEKLNIWLDREFDSEGRGSIFPVYGFKGDMRNMEIWNQMNTYLTTYYPANKNWLD